MLLSSLTFRVFSEQQLTDIAARQRRLDELAAKMRGQIANATAELGVVGDAQAAAGEAQAAIDAASSADSPAALAANLDALAGQSADALGRMRAARQELLENIELEEISALLGSVQPGPEMMGSFLGLLTSGTAPKVAPGAASSGASVRPTFNATLEVAANNTILVRDLVLHVRKPGASARATRTRAPCPRRPPHALHAHVHALHAPCPLHASSRACAAVLGARRRRRRPPVVRGTAGKYHVQALLSGMASPTVGRFDIQKYDKNTWQAILGKYVYQFALTFLICIMAVGASDWHRPFPLPAAVAFGLLGFGFGMIYALDYPVGDFFDVGTWWFVCYSVVLVATIVGLLGHYRIGPPKLTKPFATRKREWYFLYCKLLVRGPVSLEGTLQRRCAAEPRTVHHSSPRMSRALRAPLKSLHWACCRFAAHRASEGGAIKLEDRMAWEAANQRHAHRAPLRVRPVHHTVHHSNRCTARSTGGDQAGGVQGALLRLPGAARGALAEHGQPRRLLLPHAHVGRTATHRTPLRVHPVQRAPLRSAPPTVRGPQVGRARHLDLHDHLHRPRRLEHRLAAQGGCRGRRRLDDQSDARATGAQHPRALSPRARATRSKCAGRAARATSTTPLRPAACARAPRRYAAIITLQSQFLALTNQDLPIEACKWMVANSDKLHEWARRGPHHALTAPPHPDVRTPRRPVHDRRRGTCVGGCAGTLSRLRTRSSSRPSWGRPLGSSST